MKLQEVETLIISDVHLGSAVSRAGELIEALKKFSFKRLILLGDIFDDLNFNRLQKSHWDFLAYVRDLSSSPKNIEIVWVIGNHDYLLSNFSNFIGAKLSRTYLWKFGDKLCLAIHGHQFDSFLKENPIISAIATFLYITIQKFDTKSYRISRYLKRRSKGWLRLSDQVAKRAIIYGRLRRAKYVFCGHTHQSMSIENKGIRYFNSGCWTDVPSTLITLGKEGVVLRDFK